VGSAAAINRLNTTTRMNTSTKLKPFCSLLNGGLRVLRWLITSIPMAYRQDAGMYRAGLPTQLQTNLLSVVMLGVMVTTALEVTFVP